MTKIAFSEGFCDQKLVHYFGHVYTFRAHDYHGIVNSCRIQSTPPTLIDCHIIGDI